MAIGHCGWQTGAGRAAPSAAKCCAGQAGGSGARPCELGRAHDRRNESGARGSAAVGPCCGQPEAGRPLGPPPLLGVAHGGCRRTNSLARSPQPTGASYIGRSPLEQEAQTPSLSLSKATLKRPPACQHTQKAALECPKWSPAPGALGSQTIGFQKRAPPLEGPPCEESSQLPPLLSINSSPAHNPRKRATLAAVINCKYLVPAPAATSRRHVHN